MTPLSRAPINRLGFVDVAATACSTDTPIATRFAKQSASEGCAAGDGSVGQACRGTVSAAHEFRTELAFAQMSDVVGDRDKTFGWLAAHRDPKGSSRDMLQICDD